MQVRKITAGLAVASGYDPQTYGLKGTHVPTAQQMFDASVVGSRR